VTLCIAVTTSDGLVMGADSTTYVVDPIAVPTTYANADKIFQLLDFPLAVMTHGLGDLGRRTVASLINEWNEANTSNYAHKSYRVEQVAHDLTDWFFERHQVHLDELHRRAKDEGTEFKPAQYRTGLIVGGYQPNSFSPYLYYRENPPRDDGEDTIRIVREHEGPNGSLGPDPGVDWWGLEKSMSRLVKGFDAEMFSQLREHGFFTLPEGKDEKEFWEIVVRHTWPVAFEGMPLQDAVNFTEYLLRVGSGYEQFKAGMALIGGDIDIAVVGRTGLHWKSQKPLTSALLER
jgi:hypothetical protein